MGAGNVQDVFDRYANSLPWRSFAALIFMAKTSIDAHHWPYYSAGLETLAAALFRTDCPTMAQQRDVRRLVRLMVDDEVLTKTREASSLRKRERDRPAEYRLNIHDRADLELKRWKAERDGASTGVSDPSADVASTGVKDPSAESPSTGVIHPASTGVFHPETGQAEGSQTPARSTEEEEVKEDARADHVEPDVPRRPAAADSGPSPHCPKHNDNPTDQPCRRCGDARQRQRAWRVDQEAAEKAWRVGVQQWKAWAATQPRCPEEQAGGDLLRPDTGLPECSYCRKRKEADR